jgi:diguanylate cyclase (GGDEF)-like protein
MLDARTIQFTATMAAWNMALAVGLMLWRRFPRGIGLYAAALLLQAVSQTVSLLRDDLPANAGVLLSNLPLTISFSLEYVGLSIFYGRPWNRLMAFGLPALVYCGVLVCINDLNHRVAFVSAGYGLQHLLLLLLLASVPASGRNRPYYLLALTMAVTVAMFAGRAIGAATATAPPTSYFAPSPMQIWSLIMVQALFEINAVAVLLAVHHRDEDRITDLVTHDALTGVDSRHSLFAQGTHALDLTRTTGKSLSLLMIDFDHFKQTNDTHGHHVGDQVLVAATAAIRRALRPTDVLGRYGGEEFCAVLLGADQAGAFAVAERIRLAVQQAEVPLASGHIHVTVSIGVATAGSESPETFDSLLQRADRAMYSAKAAGRDCVRLHEG